jgi:hypothetical protein
LEVQQLESRRFQTQILCDFVTEGHLGRHIRRMRDMYAETLAALQHEARRYLSGLLDVSLIQAGLNTAGFSEMACHLGKRKRLQQTMQSRRQDLIASL